jgi:NAD(P)-dependent dehydrogenase (short-subunit alcohol dehydrogenase family)
LLNIAGIASPPTKDSLEATNLELFQKTFAVNTFGPMFLTQALLPNIEKSDGKKIGIVTSRVSDPARPAFLPSPRGHVR